MTGDHRDEPLSEVEHEAVEWLSRLRGGGARYQAEFEDWYSADPANADAYERVLKTWEVTTRLQPDEAPPVTSNRRWGYAVGAIAAVVALCLVIGTVLRSPKPEAAPSLAAETRIGEIRTVALDDGTKVTLDTQSAIRASFDRAERQVRLLHGRAHFEVVAEPRPFVISTDGPAVSTSGAVLDVSVFEGRTQVGLFSGAADLRPAGFKGASTRIVPGTRIVMGRDKPLAAEGKVTASDARWTVGMLSFEDTPLATVIVTANRYSDTQIALADPALGALRFTGTVKATDTLGLARMIAAMFDLRLDTSNPKRLSLARK